MLTGVRQAEEDRCHMISLTRGTKELNKQAKQEETLLTLLMAPLPVLAAQTLCTSGPRQTLTGDGVGTASGTGSPVVCVASVTTREQHQPWPWAMGPYPGLCVCRIQPCPLPACTQDPRCPAKTGMGQPCHCSF